jgi:3-oxoacyl-[acyl-carrier protein] reductase
MISPAHAKTVIVTGAASGIGLACVKGLLAAGHRVCGVDLNALPSELLDTGRSSCFIGVRADVTDPEACRRAVAETTEKFGALTSLIHMAAAHSTQTWRELSADHFNRIMAVNVTGAFLMAQAAADQIGRDGGGAIVLASSGSINVGGVGGHGRGGPAYVSSKGAIIGLTRALARSLASLGIRVNAVSPGSTDTAMTAQYDEESRRKIADRTLVGRIARPEEVAAVAQFLISDASSYVTGEIVNVNGGGSFGH